MKLKQINKKKSKFCRRDRDRNARTYYSLWKGRGEH